MGLLYLLPGNASNFKTKYIKQLPQKVFRRKDEYRMFKKSMTTECLKFNLIMDFTFIFYKKLKFIKIYERN
jgi:hypothetical protein